MHKLKKKERLKMSTLLHPLSLSMLRDAADEVVSDALMWAKYRTEITERVDEIITDALLKMSDAVESVPVTDSDDVEEIVGDFCDEIFGALEMSRGNGLASEMSEGDAIYTSDIMDFYMENPEAVDDALADSYGDLSNFGTIGDAMAAGVALALYDIASGEISEVINAFETWAKDEMVSHIFG